MRGKHIIVAVSAGIAAYKAIEVVSRLRKKGAEVKVVMTQNATYIASPLTFGEISGHPVALDMFEQVHQWDVEHIALATWADAYVVVPATANVIGKIYAGIADDMLTTTIMATTAPKYLCPAMNTEMYNNPITQRNLEGLRSLGYHIMDPAEGWLACGITGVGRLPEPEAIVDWLEAKMCSTNELEGTTILVTAGGTQESIDPVRYIGNRSSGKMGYAIAEQAAHMGAKVILVSAPITLTAIEALNKVRASATMEGVAAAGQDDFRKKVRNERRVELALEGHRFYDIRRWKIAGDDEVRNLYGVKIRKSGDDELSFEKVLIGTMYWANKMYLYPYPQNELYMNENLVQNPEW